MRANLGAAIVVASLLPATAAQAQSVWGGPASTTTTQNYKLGTNWDPNGAPVAAGQSAIFDTTGKSTINVNAGAIAPDSWTFNANSQSYTIGGAAAVNFGATGGLFNNANAGQTISIDNNLGESAAGAQLQQLGNSTLILTGNNTYSGGTVIAAGTLQIGNGGTSGKISGDVLDLGVLAFNRSNNITFAGLISGNGQVNQIGTGTLILSGANTYSGGTLIANGGTLRVNNSTPGTSSSVGTGTVTLDNGQFQAGAANLKFSNNFAINNTAFGSAIDTNGRKLTISGNIADGNGPGALTVRDSTATDGVLVLTGANTYSGGTTICNCATLQLGTAANSGSMLGTVSNEGTFNIVNANTPDITKITNDGSANFSPTDAFGTTNFRNATTASSINIVNKKSGATNFFDGSSAATASITNRVDSATSFFNSSTADSAVILNNGGSTRFFDLSNAGTATITNKNNGTTVFGSAGGNDMAGAVSANITNQQTGGATIFQALTTAGFATIDNNGGATSFFDTSNAGSANITNRNGGLTIFDDTASAAGATIVNRQGNGITPGLIFAGSSDAASANITNKTFGFTVFGENSSAASATILNQNNGLTLFGTVGDAPTAGNANITNDNGGTTQFAALSTAGSATILTMNGGATFFFDNSTGGNAQFITRAGGIVDFSQTTGPAGDGKITAGSIAGGGDYYLGGNQLTVGSNDLSTRVSGTINDGVSPLACGCVVPGSGASLVKVGTGTLTLSGTNTYTGGTTIAAGTLQLGNGGATGSILGDVTNNATLAFNRSNAYQFGGAISGSGAVQQNGAGTTTLTAVNTYGGATTISAGTLALSGAGSIANSSGVIANGTFDISDTTAGASIKTLSGTGIVTLGSQTLTLTNASGSFAGAIGGDGGLVKQGAGLFTLSGTNTYAGPTTIADGNLRVNGSVAGAVNVQSGATLSGTGSVGGLVTVQSGGTLSAGQSPGTLTVGALNLNAGSTSVFELGSPGVVGGASNDLVNVTGNLTLGGTLSVNAPSAGYYRLFNYGTLTASSFDTISGSSNGTPTVLTNVPNQVNLSIAAAGQRIQFWDGADQTGNGVVNGGTGTWNAANTNWTGAPGQANINDQWRSSVGVFAGTAGTVTVAGAQAFDTLQFSTTGYVLNAGAGGQLQLAGLSGTGTINTDNGVAATINAPIVNGSSQSLTKVGGGTLILTGTNTYSGGTTISGGTLQLGNGGTSGSITGNITDNGVLAINRSNAITLDGTISGSGAFQQLGTGTTTLTADNTYTGGTTISAGTLQLGNGGTKGSIVGNVLDNGVLVINRSNALALGGVISGPGTFNQIGSGTTTLSGANTYTGATTISNGTLVIAAGGSMTSDVTNSATFNNSGSVTGNVTNSGTFINNAGGIVSGLLTNTSISGITTNAGQLNGGALVSGGTLTNNNLISGDVSISGGSVSSHVINNQTITGAVTNAGVFDNNANGTVSGLLTNTGLTGIATNAGRLKGGALVSGGTLTNNNLISGDVNISGGSASSTGHVINNQTITGAVTNAGVFDNNANGTVAGLLTNSSTGTTTNAGHLNGGTNVTGGTLTTTGVIFGGLTNSATVNANGGAINGAISNNANGIFNVGGVVTSDGSFTNAAAGGSGMIFAAGTLAVGSTGAYTLQGMLTNSGAVTVASGGQLIAAVGGITNNAGGTITVALGGTVKDDLNNAGVVTNNGAYVANVATNTGSITNAATGTWTGNVLGNAATITNSGVWTGNVVTNAGTINNNLTWTGTVSNAGTFNNNAGATVSGLLTNTAGTTVNNGALNGGANVSGGTFTGSGTVANLTISGGIFAPGNGTPGSSMTVAGNLAFQSGAMYLVALNPTTASFANVGGTASLNGTAAAVYLAGNYVSKKYTILSAAGGVSGTFGSIVNTNVPANFTSTLSYDANHAYINLALNFVPNLAPNFGSGLNTNQQNVANALTNFFNAGGGIPAVFGTLTPGGLTQVSGEIATASQQTTFEAMNLFLGLLTDPFVAGRGDGFAPPTGAPQFAEENDATNAYAASGKPRTGSEREAYAAIYRKASIRDTYDPRWSVWSAGYGGSQTTDGNAVLGSNNTRSSIGGVAVGADYRFSPTTIAGFAVAGGGTSFSVNGLGSGRSDLFQAGAFVRHTVGPAYISAALAYGWQDVTTDRTVTVAGSDLLRANFNANTFSGRVEGGYRFVAPWIGGVGITPYAGGQFTTIDLPAYAEQAIAAANTFALSYASKSVTDTRSELGIRTDKSYAMQNGIFTLRGRAAWAHDFNPDRNIAATFQTLPGASFVVNGAAHASDAALVTGSAEMKWLNGFSLAATFEGEFSSVTRSYAGKGVVRYAW
ncbi:autotransporter-associated beta strand repeat-containing protein [Bradyrhizobium sp.]